MNAQPELFDVCDRYHKGNEQSMAANKKPDKETQRFHLLKFLSEYPNGLTCEQLEFIVGMPHQSCSARISELKRDGLIRKIGTRPTRSGCQAAVYQARIIKQYDT